MKVLIIRTVPGELDVKKMTYNIQEVGLATALQKKGIQCDIMWCSNNNEYRDDIIYSEGFEIKLYIVKSFNFLKNAWLKNVDHIFQNYDILQPCEYNQIYTRHLAKKYKGKVVVYHGPYYNKFCKNYNRMSKVFDLFLVKRYRQLNTCFITKSNLAKQFLKNKGLENVHAIGVGLNTTFLENDSVESLPELNSIKELECFKLLYIGVIEPRRNSLFLLDILKSLVYKHLSFKLILIGRFGNEDYRKQFWNKVDTEKLNDYIIYIPRVEQKYLSQVYNNTDVFILPTIYDIYGMVLLESMYFSKPTLTTINGGSNMMIENGVNGFVFEKFDSDEWASCIYDLACDTDKCKIIGDKAHDTIINGFTWDKLADKFVIIYEMKLKNNSL